MISVLKRRSSREKRRAQADVTRDPSARFAYEFAKQPPTKNVASIKAATDLFDANRDTGDSQEDIPANERSIDKTY